MSLNEASLAVLGDILDQLKQLNDKQDISYYKEWHPMVFQFYVKGYYVNDPQFGTNKWGFKRLNQDPLELDFDYEFHSLYAHTENRQYNSAFRLVLNGMSYPDIARMASEYSNYDNWQIYQGHNYCYQRAFRFARIWLYQSNHGHGEYPFKQVMKKPWNLNFDIFQSSTSYYWHFLQINGWKLHSVKSEDMGLLVKELEELVKVG